MPKKKNIRHPSQMPRTEMIRSSSYAFGDKMVEKNDIIRIDGEHGVKFMFFEHVINSKTGSEWITVFEIQKGNPAQYRSFKPDRIRLIPPKKRPRLRKPRA